MLLKKYFILIAIFYFFLNVKTYSQNTFRKDYSYYKIYDNKTNTWGPLNKGNTTVVFNINDNSDITIYYGNEKKETYRRVTEKKRSDPNSPLQYQYMYFLDSEGDRLMLGYTDDGNTLIIYVDERYPTIYLQN